MLRHSEARRGHLRGRRPAREDRACPRRRARRSTTVVLMEGEAAGTIPLAELRRMGAERADDGDRAPARRDRAVGRRHDRLHLRHDRAAEGLRHHAREPPHDGHHVRARARARRRPVDVPLPAARALARPHRPGRRAAGRRDAGLLGRRRQEDHRGGRAGRADALPVGPPRVREDPHGRAERRRRAEPPAARRVRLGARGRAPVGGPTAQRQADGTPRPRAPRASPTGSCCRRCAACSAAGCSSP